MDNNKIFSSLWVKIKKNSINLGNVGVSIGNHLSSGLINQLLKDILSLLKLNNVSLLYSNEVKFVLLDSFQFLLKHINTNTNIQSYLDDHFKSIDSDTIIGSLDHSTNNYPYISLVFLLSRYQGLIQGLHSQNTNIEQLKVIVNKIENYLCLLLINHLKGGYIGVTHNSTSNGSNHTGSITGSNRGGTDDEQFLFSEDEDEVSSGSSSSGKANNSHLNQIQNSQRLKIQENEILINVFFKFFSLFQEDLKDKIQSMEIKILLCLFAIDLSINTTEGSLTSPLSLDKIKTMVDWSLKWINQLHDNYFNNLIQFYQLLNNKFIFFKYFLKSNENVFLLKKSKIISFLNISNQPLLQLELVDILVESLFNDYGNSDGDNEDIEIMKFILDIISNVNYISDSSKQKLGTEIFQRFFISDKNHQNSLAQEFMQAFSTYNKRQQTTLFQNHINLILTPVFHKYSSQYSLKYFKTLIIGSDFKNLISDVDNFLNNVAFVSNELDVLDYYHILCKISSIKLVQHILCDLSLEDLLDFSITQELFHLNPICFRIALKNHIDKLDKNQLHLTIYKTIIEFEERKVKTQFSGDDANNLIHFKSICHTLVDISINSSYLDIGASEQLDNKSLVWILFLTKSIDHKLSRVYDHEYKLN
ncbi:hypothetical protein DICPUDRAFT_16183, partial [Dictyostelium purpureum]